MARKKKAPIKKATRKPTKSTATTARKKATPKKVAAKPPTSDDQIRRIYKGKELVIDIIDDQFIYEGQTFSSLSALATSIVGYGISGPHFFRMAMPRPGKLTGEK